MRHILTPVAWQRLRDRACHRLPISFYSWHGESLLQAVFWIWDCTLYILWWGRERESLQMHLFKDFIPLKQFAQWVLAQSGREEPGSPWYLKYLEGKALCKLNRCYLWLLWFSSKCRECLLRDYQLEGSEVMPKRPCHKRSLDQYPAVTSSRILQLLKEKLEIENYLCRMKGWSKVITLAFLNAPQPVAFLLCWCSVSFGDIH